MLNQKDRHSKYFTWVDPQWASFMIKLMQNLEPRKILAEEFIYRDLDPVDEIIFVQTGNVRIH